MGSSAREAESFYLRQSILACQTSESAAVKKYLLRTLDVSNFETSFFLIFQSCLERGEE